MKNIYLCLLAILFYGCATASGPEFKLHNNIPSSKAIGYFYQTGDVIKGDGCYIIAVDSNDQPGCLGFPGFSRFEISAGQRSIALRPKAVLDFKQLFHQFEYNFEAGKVYYFRLKRLETEKEINSAFTAQYSPFLGVDSGFILVEEERAIIELKGLKEWQ